jgi:hypothetical protein
MSFKPIELNIKKRGISGEFICNLKKHKNNN